MSSDARVWGHDDYWVGNHDDTTRCTQPDHDEGSDLVTLLINIEACLDVRGGMRWQIHVAPDGSTWLRGWVV